MVYQKIPIKRGKDGEKIFTHQGMGVSFWLYIWFNFTDQSGLFCGLLNTHCWASLVAQWLGVLRPMQGFNPCSGKIPQASWQLRPCTTPTEPVLWSPGASTTEPTDPKGGSLSALSLCSGRREAATESSQHTAAGGQPVRCHD